VTEDRDKEQRERGRRGRNMGEGRKGARERGEGIYLT